MTQVMVGAVLRRVVFNNGIEQPFNHGWVRRMPRSQADPLSMEKANVMLGKLEIIFIHTTS